MIITALVASISGSHVTDCCFIAMVFTVTTATLVATIAGTYCRCTIAEKVSKFDEHVIVSIVSLLQLFLLLLLLPYQN